ncbi:monovalent cation/H+ antiporter subunit D family protein [Woodsholea maritima]|uniref:monovalent cation/H+ antiporter subunit D family protein n=1 Tax=Woodsholea maritima TaxID=240237 RepID=UPI000370C36E|nr:monovalent cation/H+ antiporter subunit D family protein [Woodsholea maritima]
MIEASFLPAALSDHAPVLLVLVPMVLAAIVAAQPSGRFGWLAALIGVVSTLILALDIYGQMQASGAPVAYAIGGWQPPYGIEFRIDGLNIALLLLLGVMGTLALIFALPSVADEIAKSKQSLFYAAFLICFTGLVGVSTTGDAFNLFVFLEISSIPTYALIAMGAQKDRRALTASFNYLVLGTIGATFFVIGVGFLYMSTGTLNMADIARLLVEQNDNRVVQVAFGFILVGLALKAALFPLHMWLPNGYAYAPNFVTTFLASTATKVAFYALIRFTFDIFDPTASFVTGLLTWVITPLAVMAMVISSAQAIFQVNVRRILAYSSVAQVGYMMLGFGIASLAGVSAGMLHLLNHALMKGALFVALGAFSYAYGVRRIDDFKGLGQLMPGVSAAFTIGGLSLIGVPFTVGFVSKFYLVSAALERGWWWAVALIVFSSVLAVFYVYRILINIWVNPAPVHEPAIKVRRVPMMILIPLWILALANLVFGVQTDLLVGLAQDAARAALDGGMGL